MKKSNLFKNKFGFLVIIIYICINVKNVNEYDYIK